ncbi:hypothetical protein ABK040_002189 [Willaertia magna]
MLKFIQHCNNKSLRTSRLATVGRNHSHKKKKKENNIILFKQQEQLQQPITQFYHSSLFSLTNKSTSSSDSAGSSKNNNTSSSFNKQQQQPIFLNNNNSNNKNYKFKASLSESKDNEGFKGFKPNQSKLLITLFFSTLLIIQFSKYHEDINEKENLKSLQLLLSSNQKVDKFTTENTQENTQENGDKLTIEEEYEIYTNRHHFKMMGYIAMSGNSFYFKLKNLKNNKIVLVIYNPTKITEIVKQDLFENLLQNNNLNNNELKKEVDIVVILPNIEHRLFFSDYYYEFVINLQNNLNQFYKPSLQNSLQQQSENNNLPKINFLTIVPNEMKEECIKNIKKNISNEYLSLSDSFKNSLKIDPLKIMELNEFLNFNTTTNTISGNNKNDEKNDEKDGMKELVEMMKRKFTFFQFNGFDKQLRDIVMYHKDSKFICFCDLFLNFDINNELQHYNKQSLQQSSQKEQQLKEEEDKRERLIAIKNPNFEPYAIKYAKYCEFHTPCSLPHLEKKFILNKEKLLNNLNEMIKVDWSGGIGMAHGYPILINNNVELERELKERYLNNWKKHMSNDNNKKEGVKIVAPVELIKQVREMAKEEEKK